MLLLISPLVWTACTDPYGSSSNVTKPAPNDNRRNDRWGFVGPGGGGAMFHPSINPSDTENVFVSCDMTGSYVTYDGGAHWRMFNLRGVTRFYEFDDTKAEMVYAGTSNMLFKSQDKGNTWHTIYPSPEDITAINAQGDHASEVVITRDSIITEILDLAVDPHQPQHLYLLVKKKKFDFWPQSSNQARYYLAILFSSNRGEDWETVDKLRFELNNIFIDPLSPVDNRTFYVSGKDGLGVRKNGAWRNIQLPVPAGSITRYADGFDKESGRHVIYALCGRSYFNPDAPENSSGIYLTFDGGGSWTRKDQPLTSLKMEAAEDPEFRDIAVSYHYPGNIYVSFSRLHLSEDTLSFGVAKSSDFGDTWELVWEDRTVRTADSSYSIIAPNRTSGWLDKRFGPGWGENPFHLVVARDNPNICYGTDFGRTVKSMDGGASWEQVYTKKLKGPGWQSTGLQVTTGYMLGFDPFDNNHVFLAETDVGLLESFDGGVCWSSATSENGVPRAWINSTYWVTFDPQVKNRVWAAMSANHDLPRPKMWRYLKFSDYRGGVVVSDNGGKTWKPTSQDIGEAAITHILLDEGSDPSARTLYACAFGKGVYKSKDGGASWQPKNTGIKKEQPAAWRIYRGQGSTLYLVVARKSEDGSIGGEMDGAVYKSMDQAESWLQMELPPGVNGPTSLLVDAVDSSRIYISAWGRYGSSEFEPDYGGGIYVTEDEGVSWTTLLTKDQHIHDLTQDSGKGVLYASGFNSSAYRSEDQGITWERIRGYNFKWGKRVQPDPLNPEKVFIVTFGGGVWHGPEAGDHAALEDIVTEKTKYN